MTHISYLPCGDVAALLTFCEQSPPATMSPILPSITASQNGEMSEASNTNLNEETTGVRFKMRADKSQAELDLERSGNINALQRYRLTKFLKCHRGSEITPIWVNILNTEQELREIVQEEISAKQNPSRDSATIKRLRSLNIDYHLVAQRWWLDQSNLESSGQKRGFELWRSHPQWYMHSELVKDCAGRLGCCSRGCGCCLNRKIDASRALGRGHCTLECGCCAKARGFQFSESQKTSLKNLFSLNSGHHFHSIRIITVSIWGIFGGSLTNPFDMITAPPTYEQSEIHKKTEGIMKNG